MAWDQEKMMKVCVSDEDLWTLADSIAPKLSKSFGNRKPPIVVKVERLLWECILRIATGTHGCYNSLKEFFSKVDWDEIAMVSEADRHYFRNGWCPFGISGLSD